MFTRTRCSVLTLTTAGSTRLSIGASDGIGVPLTTFGSAAAAGTVAAVAGGAGSAAAGRSSISCMPVAANPPNAAAALSASRVRRALERGAVGDDECCIAAGLRGAGIGAAPVGAHSHFPPARLNLR